MWITDGAAAIGGILKTVEPLWLAVGAGVLAGAAAGLILGFIVRAATAAGVTRTRLNEIIKTKAEDVLLKGVKTRKSQARRFSA